MSIVIVNDATHAAISSLPKGQLAAGYSTGSGIVPWTAADWAAHPGAIRIDQSPVNTALDEESDVLDVENGAATIADCAPWAKAALSNYRTAARPGQRSPAIYLNLFNVTPAINALIAGGVTSGVGLWLADWDNNEAAEAAKVLAGSGPFPVIGVQFHNAGDYDVSVISGTWLSAVSRKAAPATATGWKFPRPAAIEIGRQTREGYTLHWSAVTGPSGQTPGSYSVYTYRGTELVSHQTVPHTMASEYGPGGKGLPKGTYETHVWANGGAAAPEHATITVSLTA